MENNHLKIGKTKTCWTTHEVSHATPVSPKKIQLGPRVDGGFQVLSGLDAGDEISTGSNFLLDSEARIRGAHD